MTKSSQRRAKRWLGLLLALFLGGFLALGVYILLWERPHPPDAFSKNMFVAEKIVQSQLYEIGIPKKDVVILRSTKREGETVWAESSLRVEIPRSLSFSVVEASFKQSLSSAGKSFSIQSMQKEKTLQLTVKVMDRVTHRLTFVHLEPRARVAIVIDDLGEGGKLSREIVGMDLPLTLSVLPFASHAKEIALEANLKGKEVILHLPMEPHDYPKVRPGEGVLLNKMDEAELLRQLSRDIEAVPHIKGASNHMGSRLMEDPGKMRIILSDLKRRGLFFLDSRTTPQTVGFRTAKSIGVRAAEKTLFLDHSSREKDIRERMEELTRIALLKGKAIGIGHPHPSTVKVLKEMIPKMQEKGIEIVPLSELVE